MVSNSQPSSRIAKNTTFLYVRMAVILIITLYTSRVVLNALGVVDYGIYNVVAGFVSMFSIVSSALTSCIQRYYSYEYGTKGDDGLNNVYITSIYIQVLLSVIILVLAESLGYWYIDNFLNIDLNRLDEAKWIFHLSVLSMLIVIFKVPYESAVIAKEKMDFYAIVGIIDVLLKLFLVVCLTYIPYDKLVIYTILLTFTSFINYLIFYVYAKIKIKALHFKFIFNKSLFIKVLNFSGWSTLTGFAQILQHQGVNMILNAFFGPVVNAARGISYQVKNALVSFIQNLSVAARPHLVESYAQGNRLHALNIIYGLSKVSFILLYVIILPLVYEIDYVLKLWLGNTIPDYTAIFTILVLIGTLVDILQSTISMIIYADGRIKKYNFLTSLYGIIILPLSYYLLYFFPHPEYVYYLSILSSIVILIASISIMCRQLNIKMFEYLKNVILPMLKVVGLTVFTPILIKYYLPSGFLRLFILILVSLISVFSLSYCLVFSKNEKAIIKGMLFKIYKRIRKI